LTNELITALGRTLAPFANAEKPQLFPWHAAITAIAAAPYEPIVACRRMAPRNPSDRPPECLHFVLIAFFHAPGRGGRRLRECKSIPARAAHNGKIVHNFAAGLPGRFRFVGTVTILQQSFGPISPALAATDDVKRYPPRRTAPEKARMGLRLPKSWAKAGAFSLLTRGFKLAQYSST